MAAPGMTDKEPKLTLSSVILCDDVRREDNGKDILIGVYTGDVLVPKFPISMSICLWLLMKTKGMGDFERSVRVLDPAGKIIAAGQFRATIGEKEEGFASFALTKMPLNIQSTGEIKFQWKSPGGRWKTLLTKNVQINPHFESAAT